jgi:hypothetical protein
MSEPLPEFGNLPEEFKFRRRHWILAAILALLFHVLILFPKIPGFIFNPQALAPPRVDIKQVDPRKLDAIRKQWKSRERALLLDKNLHVPTAAEPPPDARYMSDRNIKVEKEQRAKQTTLMPKAGAAGEPAAPAAPSKPQPPAHPKTEPDKPRSHFKFPSLGNLGVPLPAAPTHATPRQQPQPSHMTGSAVNSGEDGGSQYVKDPNLPEGSENLLNAQESVYYSFYSRLYDALAPVWKSRIRQAAYAKRRLQPGEYTTTVDAVYDRNGNLVEINQLAGSSIEEFDKAAMSAFRAIGRVPNPPEGLLNPEGKVHIGWSFTVQLNQGMNLDTLPRFHIETSDLDSDQFWNQDFLRETSVKRARKIRAEIDQREKQPKTSVFSSISNVRHACAPRWHTHC